MSTFLFVYGTLRRRSRHPMAKRLADAARYVGPATIAGRLYDLGRFPGLKPPRHPDDRVHGDVYDLGPDAARTLQDMDAYENAESPPPTPYDRQQADALMTDGSALQAWVYWYQGDVREECFIASGSYEQNCEPAEPATQTAQRNPMLLEIAQLGQPILRQRAIEVPPDGIAEPEFQAFLEQMHETLKHEKGIGLAAPQVFIRLRVFLAGILEPAEPDGLPGLEAIINPTITPLTGATSKAWEGCLSFPELLVLVPRFTAVRIEYRNARGELIVRDLDDLAARVVQHEFDHLEGILTLDRAESTLDIIKASEADDVLGGEEEEGND